jgi:hypothetical protein
MFPVGCAGAITDHFHTTGGLKAQYFSGKTACGTRLARLKRATFLGGSGHVGAG